MNSSDQSGPSSQRVQPVSGKWHRRKGVALILVVAFIVLLSALVVGFFSRVSTDLTGARSYAEGISARQLAESAVSVVMGQIRAATTITNGCWASQPGMIRVYGSAGGGASSQAYRFYKLYSSHNMVLGTTDFPTFNPNTSNFTDPNSGANAEVPIGPNGWQNQPAYFTDLNAPVAVSDPKNPGKTVNRYPIFDPTVASIPALGQNIVSASGIWPAGSVEGCAVNIKDTATLALNKAPMPVRWIYVLRDGTLTAPTPLKGPASGNSGLQAQWNNLGSPAQTPSTGVPSKDNPIVGRIAFWTDDDTCKVNINTAGGYVADEPANPDYTKAYKTVPESNPAFIAGSFWDTPRVQTYFDRGVSGFPVATGQTPSFRGGLASSQPVRNEFQRYPGHPSTTSLGLVLKGLLPANSGLTSETLYDFTPRLMSGVWKSGEVRPPNALAKNSEGGSQQLVAYNQQINPATMPLDPDPPCTTKKTYDPTAPAFQASNPSTWSWHLLGSVDELYYSTLNTTATNSDGTRITTNKQSNLNNAFTQDIIDKARFFLTAHSRSPELNLFGRPRVSIWPIPTHASEGQLLSTPDPATHKLGIRNPSDDLLQFCSTVGASPNDPSDPNGLVRKGQFIFDREDPYSATADFNRTRNRQIFNYLHQVTSNSNGKIPGWGQSFEAKYAGGSGRDQILTEIFDYIRTVNLKDTSRDQRIDQSQGRTSVTQPLNKNAEALKLYARYAKRGIVVPTRASVNGTQVSGFGRFPTISEISLVLYHGGYIYRPRKPANAPEDVEYNFDLLDERNYPKGPPYKTWFDNNDITGQLVRAFLIVETFNPMQGYGPVTRFDNSTTSKERIVYEIKSLTGFNIQATGGKYVPLGLPSGGVNNVYLSSGDTWAGRNFGGTEGFFHTMQGKVSNIPYYPAIPPFPWGTATFQYDPYGGNPTPTTPGQTNQPQFKMTGGADYYPFQSPCQKKMDGVRIPYNGVGADPVAGRRPQASPLQTLNFSGGTVVMQVRYTDGAHLNLPTHNETTQTFTFTFPPGTNWPAPITEKDAAVSGQGFRQDLGGFDNRYAYPGPPKIPYDATGTGFGSTGNWSSNGGYRMPYYLPLRINWASLNSWSPWTKFDAQTGAQVGDGNHYANRFLQILQPGDTIRSLVPGGNVSESSDPRTVHLQQQVTSTSFGPHPDYNSTNADLNNRRRAQTLRCGSGTFYFDPTNAVWFPGQSALPTSGMLASLPANTRYLGVSAPDLPKTVIARQKSGAAADFDTGIGNFPDGAFCGKADEGNIARSWKDEWGIWHFVEPYFSTWVYDSPGDTYFSPNRQIPSPVMFGSLLAPNINKMEQAGWKTLLFCPNPAAGTIHPGFSNPPDHLLLDLFNMPVVEPYAISEPFSTDGKVNLNYQMMPFNYIERSTALRAALHPLRVTAIPNNFTRQNGSATELRYKGVDNDQNLRYLVDREQTLKAFAAFFNQYTPGQPGLGFFKAASQICEMYLYPKGQPYNHGLVTFTPGDSNIKAWWGSCTVTGDNVREKPYSDLYSRVTTKSNTYTVHYRVQSLRQQPYSGDPNSAAANTYYQTWDESRDKVLSEYRGHTTIERYLDPRDPRFYKTINPDTDSLESASPFRLIYNKRFSPW